VIEFLFLGIGFAFAAAAQPGPFQAFLLHSVTTRGWKRTLPAALAPLVSDGPIAVLTLFVLNRLPETMSGFLQAAGGALLLYLAWTTYREWRRPSATGQNESGHVPSTLLQAAAVNILNPNPYLGWSLVLGPAALRAWHAGPANAIALIASFYVTMIVSQGSIIILLGTTGFLGPRGRRLLVHVSAGLLASLGVYQLVAGLLRTTAGRTLQQLERATMLDFVSNHALTIVLGVSLFLVAWAYLSVAWGAPWVPSSFATIRRMLEMAGVKPGEVVIDLGAGDGRIVVIAARSYGASAIGVEIDPLRCLVANAAITLLGLRQHAHVHLGDMFTFDTSVGDVVVLYLLQGTNQRIKDKLIRELRPGARVVSHTFSMTGWVPVALDDRRGIFVYEIGRIGEDVRTEFV
jgi:threonine/homoserine/homoserine lactone efflux protein/phospholipid N-methyltransferase